MLEKRENFTRGPWKAVVIGSEKPNKVYVERETSYAGRTYTKQSLIATLPAHNGCAYIEDRANLALIASAPEMYEMLRCMRKCIETYGLHCSSVTKMALSDIDKVLAKARGEEVQDGE